MLQNAYVINLDSRPDRWDSMQRQLRTTSIRATRVPAVVGKEIDVRKLAIGPRSSACLLTGEKSSRMDIDSLGALGCSLSHIAVWREIAARQTEELVLVLEDDCVLPEGFDSVLQSAQASGLEFLSFGAHAPPSYKGSVKVQTIVFQILQAWTEKGKDAIGSHAYAVTPRVAGVLLEHAFPLDLSIDYYMYATLHKHGIPIGFLQSVGTAWSAPDIQHPPTREEARAKRKGFLTGAIVATCVILCILFFYSRLK